MIASVKDVGLNIPALQTVKLFQLQMYDMHESHCRKRKLTNWSCSFTFSRQTLSKELNAPYNNDQLLLHGCKHSHNCPVDVAKPNKTAWWKLIHSWSWTFGSHIQWSEIKKKNLASRGLTIGILKWRVGTIIASHSRLEGDVAIRRPLSDRAGERLLGWGPSNKRLGH